MIKSRIEVARGYLENRDEEFTWKEFLCRHNIIVDSYGDHYDSYILLTVSSSSRPDFAVYNGMAQRKLKYLVGQLGGKKWQDRVIAYPNSFTFEELKGRKWVSLIMIPFDVQNEKKWKITIEDLQKTVRGFLHFQLREIIDKRGVWVSLEIVEGEDIPSCVRKKYPKKKPRKLTKPT